MLMLSMLTPAVCTAWLGLPRAAGWPASAAGRAPPRTSALALDERACQAGRCSP